MKKHILQLTAITFLSLMGLANASNDKTQYQQAIQQLSNQKVDIISVKDSAVKGFKEIVVKGGLTQDIVYMSENGEFMFQGNLMNLKSQQNLTEMSHDNIRHDLLTKFQKNHKSINFFPKEMTDHITVFTDIDCGFCRKLHHEMKQYNDLGIGVSYFFFPRSGLNTASHQKAVNVWCAEDQQAAMDSAKNGDELEPLMCANSTEEQFNLGIGLGIHKVGTPAVIFDDGSIMPGYSPAAQMKQKIQLAKNLN